MRKTAFVLLVTASVAFCQSYYETQTLARTTFFSGIALAFGKSGLNPGVNACLEPVKKINSYLSVGGHIDYTWFSASGLPADTAVNLHAFDISFVPKACWPLGKDKNITFEIDPGWYGILNYFHAGAYYETVFNKRFGLTTAPGFTINNFSFAVKVKTIFTESADSRYVKLIAWIALCAGIAL